LERYQNLISLAQFSVVGYIALLTSFPHIKLPCKTNIEPLHTPVIKAGIENAMEIE
jgi:hypothetical protein